MRKYIWFLIGVLVGASFKGEFKVTVKKIDDRPDPEKGRVQLTQYINSGGLQAALDEYARGFKADLGSVSENRKQAHNTRVGKRIEGYSDGGNMNRAAPEGGDND